MYRKLHFAAHGHTSAEVIHDRADSQLPKMCLTSFAGDSPRKQDISVAKNYLTESELKKLNTLVSAYFDAAEFRAENHEKTYMKDWLAHLDRLIVAMEAPTLADAGKVSRSVAVSKATAEYEKFLRQRDAHITDIESAYLASIQDAACTIEGNKL